jgi:CDP-diglyceride synthetase
MAKIYFKKQKAAPKMSPKKDTINFLLSYSKALNIYKAGSLTFENISN